MNILENVFVKKAIKSMMTPEQFTTVQSIMTAVQSGKIDKNKLKRVGDKMSNLSPDEVNSLLDLIDKNLK
jgi:hypothetical protein